MTTKTTTPTTTPEPSPIETYLQPVLAAAQLLQLQTHPATTAQLVCVLDKLSPNYPGDVLPRLEALRILTGAQAAGGGTVDELDILARIWPDWSGDVRYKLTATTLTRTWSSKHSGVYATITVPFPTILPLTVTVVRFCDMDQQNNHSDDCPAADEDSDGDCNCEAWVEQTVSATVTDWTDAIEAPLAAWLAAAVIEQVEPATFPAPEPATAAKPAKRTTKRTPAAAGRKAKR